MEVLADLWSFFWPWLLLAGCLTVGSIAFGGFTSPGNDTRVARKRHRKDPFWP